MGFMGDNIASDGLLAIDFCHHGGRRQVAIWGQVLPWGPEPSAGWRVPPGRGSPLAKDRGVIYRPPMTWNDAFLELFDRCVAAYRGGNPRFESYYMPEDLVFLASIGCQTREFFDFVEDFCEEGQPSASTALLVAAVRRDYFLTAPHGVAGGGREAAGQALVTQDDLPTFGDELAGLVYLPRILAKARGKLRGTLDPDLMFGCGGDRKFLNQHGGIPPADFLRRVWAYGDDEEKLADWVAQQGTAEGTRTGGEGVV